MQLPRDSNDLNTPYVNIDHTAGEINTSPKSTKEKDAVIKGKPSGAVILESGSQQSVSHDMSTRQFTAYASIDSLTKKTYNVAIDSLDVKDGLSDGGSHASTTIATPSTTSYAILDEMDTSTEAADIDIHERHKEKFMSLMSQNLDVTSRYGEENDIIPQLNERVNYLKSGNIGTNLEFIGQGQFKTAMKIMISSSNKFGEFKVKPLVVSAITLSDEMAHITKKTFENEKNIMILTAKDSIPGVLPNYGVLHDQQTGNYILVTKYCNKGDLKNYANTMLNNNKKKQIALLKQSWDGLKNFHKTGYSHRDIKLSNFLVHENKQQELKIYLGDLGLAFSSKEFLRDQLSSNLNLLPPFAKRDRSVNLTDPKLDTWAFGLMICNLMRMANPELAYNADEPQFSEILKTQTWMKPNLTQEEAQREVGRFIEETFEKAPLTNDKEVNDNLKKLVTQMMGKNLESIIDENEVTPRLNEIFNSLS
jgi:serine/threonine protein kinase